MKEPLGVGSLLHFEFANALRIGAMRKLYPVDRVTAALAAFEADRDAGRVVIQPAYWDHVHAEAERLSDRHTLREGQSSFDILHVATALTLGAKEFLTFDTHRRKLATAEGLKVRP